MTNVRSLWVVVVVALAIGACAATPGRIEVHKPVSAWDSPQGWAIEGYDPVSYFKDQKPIVGDDAFTLTHDGAKWKFASREHLEAFGASPERFLPQYGGYCAYAVSRGTIAHGSARQWAVVDDKLYLNNNALAKQLWDQDRSGNITAGDQNWPLIPKKAVATH